MFDSVVTRLPLQRARAMRAKYGVRSVAYKDARSGGHEFTAADSVMRRRRYVQSVRRECVPLSAERCSARYSTMLFRCPPVC